MGAARALRAASAPGEPGPLLPQPAPSTNGTRPLALPPRAAPTQIWRDPTLPPRDASEALPLPGSNSTLRGAHLAAPAAERADPGAWLVAALRALLPAPLAVAARAALVGALGGAGVPPAIAAAVLRRLAADPLLAAAAPAPACAAALARVKPAAAALVAAGLRAPCGLLLACVADAIERGGGVAVAPAAAAASTSAAAG